MRLNRDIETPLSYAMTMGGDVDTANTANRKVKPFGWAIKFIPILDPSTSKMQ